MPISFVEPFGIDGQPFKEKVMAKKIGRIRGVEKRIQKLVTFVGHLANKRKKMARIFWDRMNSHGRRLDAIEMHLRSSGYIAPYENAILFQNTIPAEVSTCEKKPFYYDVAHESNASAYTKNDKLIGYGVTDDVVCGNCGAQLGKFAVIQEKGNE